MMFPLLIMCTLNAGFVGWATIQIFHMGCNREHVPLTQNTSNFWAEIPEYNNHSYAW